MSSTRSPTSSCLPHAKYRCTAMRSPNHLFGARPTMGFGSAAALRCEQGSYNDDFQHEGTYDVEFDVAMDNGEAAC